jgi:hypothetical protein
MHHWLQPTKEVNIQINIELTNNMLSQAYTQTADSSKKGTIE